MSDEATRSFTRGGDPQTVNGEEVTCNACNPLIFLGRSERIRTFDPLVPNQMRYQAALRSEEAVILCMHLLRVNQLLSFLPRATRVIQQRYTGLSEDKTRRRHRCN